MNPESEDFDALRRLLALKRYEQPPPGYFNRFSRDVMARIKAGEKGGAAEIESSWFQRLLSIFDVKPVFAGAFGTAVCAFVISGVVSSERAPALATMSPSSFTPSVASAVPVDVSAPTEGPGSSATPRLVAASTNSDSLFNQFPPVETKQASWDVFSR